MPWERNNWEEQENENDRFRRRPQNWIRHGHRVCCYAEAAEKYLDSAYAAAWDLLKASDSTYYDVLREKFYDR